MSVESHTESQQTAFGTMAGSQSQKTRIALPEHVDAFVELVERDPRICNNCFGLREKSKRHFRSTGGCSTGGGEDMTADFFCTECHAGTGQPDLLEQFPDLIDYSQIGDDLLDPGFVSDMAGTVERDWSEDDPLPLNGQQVSFFGLMCNLRKRYQEMGHNVDWDEAKTLGAFLKNKHPSRDRMIFARVFAETVQ